MSVDELPLFVAAPVMVNPGEGGARAELSLTLSGLSGKGTVVGGVFNTKGELLGRTEALDFQSSEAAFQKEVHVNNCNSGELILSFYLVNDGEATVDSFLGQTRFANKSFGSGEKTTKLTLQGNDGKDTKVSVVVASTVIEAGKKGKKKKKSAAPAPAEEKGLAPPKSPAAGSKTPQKSPANGAQKPPKSPAGKASTAPLFPEEDESKGKDAFKSYNNDSCLGVQTISLDSIDYIPDQNRGNPQAKLGHPFLIVTWAQYHKPGYKFLPFYSEIAKKYAGKLTVVGLAMDPDNQGASKFVKDPEGKYSKIYPVDFAMAHDNGWKFKKFFSDALRGTLSVPHSFLFDAKGKIVWHQDHSELGATVPTRMRALEVQLDSFISSGKILKVGDRVVVEADDEDEEEEVALVGGDGDTADPFDFM